MVEHDDLSQLMPTLYSRIRLSSATEETANLAQYARVQHALSAPGGLVISKQAADGLLQKQPLLANNTRGLLKSESGRGTGRTVSLRRFDLHMRSASYLVLLVSL